MSGMQIDSKAGEAGEYRVLARKYRPKTFADMIGQEALVKTLTNAIHSGRLAHAFMLTGVRGVGKTTTARIVARALNCTGADGTGGPTPEPCGVCDACVAIAADRHPDVIEMDAASRTGVDDIREIIDGVRYKPISARYKIYIIDEVHMLTKNAFNALLKTLEEPPEHTKFLFATTEIRKVPITVLSRCQRFDLRRIEPDTLAAYFTEVAQKEGITLAPDAAALIGRAADGSARDGMSLLDQAIALSAGQTVTADTVRDMLGLADRGLVLDLFAHVMGGRIAEALALYDGMHRSGADPTQVMQDLMELCHTVTRARVAPGAMESALHSERERMAELTGSLSVAALTRAWQILVKGAQEVRDAGNGRAALDMVLIRLAYVSDLPSPADLVRRLTGDGGGTGTGAPSGVSGGVPGGGAASSSGPRMTVMQGGGAARAVAAPSESPAQASVPQPRNFEDVVALFAAQREQILSVHLQTKVQVIGFETGKIELALLPDAPRDLPARVGSLLTQWTGQRWLVAISAAPAAAGQTLHDRRLAAAQAFRAKVLSHPLVQQVLTTFNLDEKAVEAIRPYAIPEPSPDTAAPAGPGMAVEPGADLDYSDGAASEDDDFLDHTF